jgi:hypothetical protein
MKYAFERYVETLDLWVPQTITHVSEARAMRWLNGVTAKGVGVRDFRRVG